MLANELHQALLNTFSPLIKLNNPDLVEMVNDIMYGPLNLGRANEWEKGIFRTTELLCVLEGAYQAIKERVKFDRNPDKPADNDAWKEIQCNLLRSRQYAWGTSWCSPTLAFLYSFESQINAVKKYFTAIESRIPHLTQALAETEQTTQPTQARGEACTTTAQAPWRIDPSRQLHFDRWYGSMIDANGLLNIKNVPIPPNARSPEVWQPTSGLGGYQIIQPHNIYRRFERITTRKKTEDKPISVLVIGPGYGVEVFKFLKLGCVVIAVDLFPENLAIIQRLWHEMCDQDKSLKFSNLILIPGAFPSEVCLQKKYFSVIVANRVLHFLPGDLLKEACKEISLLLQNNGKACITVDTDQLGCWIPNIGGFIEERRKAGIAFAGEIWNPRKYNKEFAPQLPPELLHLMRLEDLKGLLLELGLASKFHLRTLDQQHYPASLQYKFEDPEKGTKRGKESVLALFQMPGSQNEMDQDFEDIIASEDFEDYGLKKESDRDRKEEKPEAMKRIASNVLAPDVPAKKSHEASTTPIKKEPPSEPVAIKKEPDTDDQPGEQKIVLDKCVADLLNSYGPRFTYVPAPNRAQAQASNAPNMSLAALSHNRHSTMYPRVTQPVAESSSSPSSSTCERLPNNP